LSGNPFFLRLVIPLPSSPNPLLEEREVPFSSRRRARDEVKKEKGSIR